MAYSPSPQLSPNLIDRHHSQTPPLQPISKRDKRRTLLSERLADITMEFSRNRDFHYRQQLQAIQTDMNLIMRADPYDDAPLDDDPEYIQELVHNLIGGNAHFNGDISAIAGKTYSDFAREIGDALEDRDAALVMHKVSDSPQTSIESLN